MPHPPTTTEEGSGEEIGTVVIVDWSTTPFALVEDDVVVTVAAAVDGSIRHLSKCRTKLSHSNPRDLSLRLYCLAVPTPDIIDDEEAEGTTSDATDVGVWGRHWCPLRMGVAAGGGGGAGMDTGPNNFLSDFRGVEAGPPRRPPCEGG